MGIIYALCCLAFAAVNDFIFKLFSSSGTGRRTCGLFVSIVGWVMVLFYALFRRPDGSGDLKMTLLWGSVAGAMSLSSNVLVIEAMRHQTAGVCSTIFRLNMVLVVLGAHFLLGEPLGWTLVCGIVCAFCAILAFVPSGGLSGGKGAVLGFSMAVIACFLRACMSLAYKYGFSSGAEENGVAMINGLFWALGGIVIAIAQERRLCLPSVSELKIGVVSGAFVTGIIVFMARMNMCGNASVVNPIAQMSFLGTMVLSCVFLKEKLDVRKVFALVMGCGAVVLLSINA